MNAESIQPDKLLYAASKLGMNLRAVEQPVAWKTLDQLPLSRIKETAINCIMMDDLENALFGLLYLYYQKVNPRPTNIAEGLLKNPALKYEKENSE